MLILAVASASPTSSISSGVNIGFTATQVRASLASGRVA
jgi:hypothetical protein